MPSAADPDPASAAKTALAALRAHHLEIDREAERLAARHADRLRCGRGCSACCLDDLTVLSVEAERIRLAHPELLAEGAPHPSGACAFLDGQGACRIYPDRPSVCRSQGLPLRVLFEDATGEIAERRDICELNLPDGPPLDDLAEDDLWLIGSRELRLLEIDARFVGRDSSQSQFQAGAEPERVSLRSLFVRSATPG